MTSNTTNYCKNLLEQALAKELCILDEPSQFKDGVYLVKNIQASQKSLQTLSNLIGEPIHAARTSQLASINHVPCHKDDVVVYQTGPNDFRVAQVQLHFSLRGAIATLVKAWDVQEWVATKQFAICRVSETNLGFIPTADILAPVVYHKGATQAKVLLPYPVYTKLQR